MGDATRELGDADGRRKGVSNYENGSKKLNKKVIL